MVDLRPGLLAELGGDLAADDLVAGLERDLGDPGAHGPQADDSYAANLHRRESLGKKKEPPRV